MYRFLALICVCLTGCASVPESYWQINRATSERFTYVTDFEKHGVPDYREEGVTGDEPEESVTTVPPFKTAAKLFALYAFAAR